MGKIHNVNLFSIFAIMLVGLAALGYVTMTDKSGYVNAGQKKWNVIIDSENYSSYGAALDGNGPEIGAKSIDFNLVFQKPGDYKTYTFEVDNVGNVNAHLDSVNWSLAEEKDGLSFSYVIYKGQNVILDSANGNINADYNHLYRTSGTNTVEVTFRYDPVDKNAGATLANYTMKLNYEED